ncbi:chromosome segregation protein SMC [Leptothrix cholodnii SP-6]|uniref:Chromosome partition protein Smc n=1 Tax=Leptothrix cholodnii (strain ATCC 51168 / LMG 8142 / SP-6) TaxID=395495 RepID=B1Y6E3_LEPCP|nr:chromosome segregation protein SMC [Leptothrix cholodnii]ACB34779.1 chromosome segregation protein SMC [Leptothrix cholodnii SP-6]
MRLNSIKLSGFKSFAEPTHFQLPGQLVGVVGPNGCGKSNIMDAVRWVLGESKASELRGESMQDVIFNGSGNRKPASRASVELIFDNASARAGGQWNQFTEIAVKRVLTRDGTSSYYINNQPVRRRDVQDVFLGTGLGPRAYAIIGQGTISRIIESRPEELRLFLEEAAGVSKYKERRRETENRLKDTRENLTRVDDILRELNSNLERLEAQAAVAQRYRGLQDAGTLKLHQLWFLKHRDATSEQDRVREAVLTATNALESRLAELRHVEAELEEVRQQHFGANDELHAAQGALAEVSMEVSRLEERIRHVVEGRARAQQRLADSQAQNAQWTQRREQAETELETLADQIAAAEEQGEVLAAQAEDQAMALPGFEDAVRAATNTANQQRARAAEVQQQIQLLAAQSRNLDERRRELNQRRDRLAGERRGLVAPDLDHLAGLRAQLEQAQEQQALADEQLQELAAEVPTLDEQRRHQQNLVNSESARAAAVKARLEALRALQEKVQTEGKLKPWLAKHGLDGLAGLWTRIHIETGWETALEAVLRERIGALAVGRIETVRAFELDPPPAKLAFYTAPLSAIANSHQTLPRLSDLLRLADPGLKALLNDWLEGVYTAASLDEALANRQRLTHGEVIMTAAGHAVSQFAVSFYAPDAEQAGMLARAQEIENLELEGRAQALLSDEARSALVRAEAQYTDAAMRLARVRREAQEAQTRAHQLQVDVLRLAQQAEQATQRRDQLDAELHEIDANLEENEERRMTGEARFEELDIALGTEQERHAELEEAVIAADRRLSDAREKLRSLERAAQEAQFSARALAARRGELQRSIETAVAQQHANAHAAAQIEDELARFDDAAAEGGLQEALALRLEREQVLGAARSRYDDLSAQLRRADEQRLAFERSLQPLRDEITRLQLEEQAAHLGGAQFMEQLQAAEVDLAMLAAGIEADAVKLYGLQTEIDRINREIAALGAVNLAALDELKAASERKGFLDAQNDDLTRAMNTLEDAIRKIDIETRDLLKGTFDQVNEGFGQMFPSLFGGGQARLVMTGDEILDAGVQVMAQPPGKKNSTIHLLSGGEKALTAIALVFAIFLLNPAPFCLLDEVDAPLDDANTERYAKLVEKMSAGTQFLFISHNKIAMEMAQQLIGVTMQEQGVSRIVAVDMDSALSMAEA